MPDSLTSFENIEAMVLNWTERDAEAALLKIAELEEDKKWF